MGDKMSNNSFAKSAYFKCILAFGLMCAVMISMCSCTGVDPNVEEKETKSGDYQVETQNETTDVELDGFHAYGDGMTAPLTVKGVKVNVEDFALRSYELAFMLAQPKFKSVNDIPVDALAQFAFAHLYYENLYEIPNKMTDYCQTTQKKLNDELKKHFGENKVDLTKSELYNKSKKKFEMWMPEYGQNIYYKVDAANVEGDKAVIITTFYNELKKTTKLGRTTITVKIKDGKPVIAELSAD